MAKLQEDITQEYLCSILHYDPKTGIWRWRKGRNNPTEKTRKSRSGHVGIDWHTQKGKWRARLGREKHLGLFDTIEEAVAARQSAIDARDTDKVAGTISEGYVVIWIEGRFYRAHRLAHLYMTGEWPPADIDHKDLDRGDNRWERIRPATRSQNFCNTDLRKDNTSGYKGVHFHKPSGKWKAVVTVNHKTIYLGLFTNIEDAVATRKEAAEDLHGVFVRHSNKNHDLGNSKYDKINHTANTKTRKNNTSGHKGVHWHKGSNKWCVRFNVNGRQMYLGLFDKLEDAIAARKEAAERLHGDFVHHA